MCGIAGVWGKESLLRAEAMLPTMLHRGPDGSGVWSSGQLTLGHRRLAINDLSESGSQPMISPDQRVAICVNGEIYNYPELKCELESLGRVFLSSSDSEVVLHAWAVWGENCFARFNGMFAIALFDVDTNKLILARDRLGIKPLYYSYSDSGDLVFASEIGAVCAGKLDYKSTVDPIGLIQYLTYQNYFGSRTLRNNVSMLPAGQLLELNVVSGEVRSSSYWELKYETVDNTLDFNSSVDLYRQTLDSSVRRHLLSDVPVASYLSAGFDSASVAASASRLGTPPVSFTGTFAEGGWYDETTMASSLASLNGSEHRSVQICYKDVPRIFDRLMGVMGDPRMGMGALPQYCVAEQVALSHKVILTGHGGDELFSGYPVFKLINLISTFKKDPASAVKQMAGLRFSELPHLVYFLLGRARSSRYRQFLPVLNGSEDLAAGLRPEYASALLGLDPVTELVGLDTHAQDEQDVLYSHYLQAYLGGLLVVEDRLSMAHSLESRTPMLDNEMLALSLKIPQSIKMNNGVLKAIVKEGGRSMLPSAMYNQPKRGFPTPLRIWLRGPLQQWFTQRIVGPDSALPLIFKPEWLKKVHDRYLYSSFKHLRPLDEIQSQKMWQLLSLESCLKQGDFN